MNPILLFLTGLTLFLFGMIELSAGMREHFNNVRIREYFKFAVRKPLYGLVTGIVSTILLQSSTATSVLVVGMVSAGLMSFYRSLGILLGADIGTTFTVQLVVWKVTDLSPLFILFGGLLWFTGKDRWRSAGQALFYFGIMFFGLSLVSQAAAPLKDHPDIIRFLREANHPLIGFAAGLVLASLIHSSAIPISLLVILAQYGWVTLENALPIVFGANVGTAITAILASFVANVNGKRSALSHFLFKFFGTVICFLFFPFFIAAVKSLSGDAAQQIALGHLLFNVVIVGAFIFLLRPFSYGVERFIPGKAEALPIWPEYLDERSLSNPEEALGCVQKELKRELILSRSMYTDTFRLIKDYREGKRKDILYVEFVVNNLRNEVARYLWKISSGPLSEEHSKKLFVYAAIVDDIESIANHTVNILELCRHRNQRNVDFSRWAFVDLEEIGRLLDENLADALSLIEERDEEKIRSVTRREDEVDRKVMEAREKHLERFHKRICQAEAGPIYVGMLVNLERISDHCQNIADFAEELK
jgi:phosphate:Na+ symporter